MRDKWPFPEPEIIPKTCEPQCETPTPEPEKEGEQKAQLYINSKWKTIDQSEEATMPQST